MDIQKLMRLRELPLMRGRDFRKKLDSRNLL